jgi:hypothetical protein
MAVVQAKIQTVEDMYALIRTAVTSRRSFSALYGAHRRLLCPHRLGRNNAGRLRVLCYQYGGESGSGLEPLGSPANWRCIVVEKLRVVTLLEDGMWCTAANHSRPQTCVTDADVDAEDYPGPHAPNGH